MKGKKEDQMIYIFIAACNLIVVVFAIIMLVVAHRKNEALEKLKKIIERGEE